ncbi:uncharacterized protein BXZ73DRAFT_102998 [Epithele typhae]|uniref:uncharacterized protein n=1 Tax=Epithele typhae TaxID=378194 RepID=UPI002008589F|nr:uncharacterized protein BXZ73DRAFT_102998 [Epithele typhae]KAH9926317.1 hypothetical protein BXZ73DRAFT_102998 [Epithele typhae]
MAGAGQTAGSTSRAPTAHGSRLTASVRAVCPLDAIVRRAATVARRTRLPDGGGGTREICACGVAAREELLQGDIKLSRSMWAPVAPASVTRSPAPLGTAGDAAPAAVVQVGAVPREKARAHAGRGIARPRSRSARKHKRAVLQVPMVSTPIPCSRPAAPAHLPAVDLVLAHAPLRPRQQASASPPPLAPQVGGWFPFDAGPLAARVVRFTIDEIQQASRGRRYGQADKRPLDPPPVVRLRAFQLQHAGTPYEAEVELDSYDDQLTHDLICHIDLFSVPRPRVLRPPTASLSPAQQQEQPQQPHASAESSTSTSTSRQQVPEPGAPWPFRPEAMCTEHFGGSTFVACRPVEYQGAQAAMFVFAGWFAPRYRVFQIGGKIFSTKNFPGLPPSTELTKQLSSQGISLNSRLTKRKAGTPKSTGPPAPRSRVGERERLAAAKRKREADAAATASSPSQAGSSPPSVQDRYYDHHPQAPAQGHGSSPWPHPGSQQWTGYGGVPVGVGAEPPPDSPEVLSSGQDDGAVYRPW